MDSGLCSCNNVLLYCWLSIYAKRHNGKIAILYVQQIGSLLAQPVFARGEAGMAAKWRDGVC